MLRYNTDEDSFEGYIDGAWGGISGAQANGCIYENNVDITANYTLTAGKNGFSVWSNYRGVWSHSHSSQRSTLGRFIRKIYGFFSRSG